MTIMATKKEKFLALVSETDTKTAEKNAWRIANRHWLRVSQTIAFDILERLEALGWTQKALAEKMGVSPQYVNKIVKGSENLTLETIVTLQTILEIPILLHFIQEKDKNRADKLNGTTKTPPQYFEISTQLESINLEEVELV
jgi:transcriptional regulator with XRE-family HTH domain